MALKFKDTTPPGGPIRAQAEIGLAGIEAAISTPGGSGDAGGANKELIELLERTHPEYNENIDTWKKMGDFAFKRIKTTEDKQTYLVQGDVEEDNHFEMRATLVRIMPETPNQLSDFLGAVFSKDAQRTFTKEDTIDGKTVTVEQDVEPSVATAQGVERKRIQAFIDDAGPEKEPLTRQAEKTAKNALVYGFCDTFLDHATDGSENPDIVLYTPETRLDWQLGPDGLYQWVKYLEEIEVQADFNTDRMKVKLYRVIRQATVDSVDTDGTLIPAAGPTVQLFTVMENGSGEKEVFVNPPVVLPFNSIPVRTLKWAGGEPWIDSLVEGDIDILRQESDLRWDTFVHAHPWIIAWLHDPDDTGKALSAIKLGAQWATQLDPGGDEIGREDIQYLAPDMAELQFQADQIREARESVRRMAGSSSATVQDTPSQPESGVALAYRQAQLAKQFIQLSRALQGWESQIIELVAGVDDELEKIFQVKYPDSFDQRLVPELADDLEIANEIGSETLIKEIKKELATKLIGSGESQATIQQIIEEIDGAAVDEPEDRDDSAADEPTAGSDA